jgi:hypothetical protein
VEKANKMMLVRNSYRLKHRIEAADDEVEKAFWIEDLAAYGSCAEGHVQQVAVVI